MCLRSPRAFKPPLSLSLSLSHLSSFSLISLFYLISLCSFIFTLLFRWPLFSSSFLSLARTDKDFVPADHRLHSPLYASFFFPFFILSLFLSSSLSLLSSVFIPSTLRSRTDQPTALCEAPRPTETARS